MTESENQSLIEATLEAHRETTSSRLCALCTRRQSRMAGELGVIWPCGPYRLATIAKTTMARQDVVRNERDALRVDHVRLERFRDSICSWLIHTSDDLCPMCHHEPSVHEDDCWVGLTLSAWDELHGL